MLLFVAIQFAIYPMTNKRQTLIATSLENNLIPGVLI